MPHIQALSDRHSATPGQTAGPYTIRDLATWSEYQACVALQQEIWGVDFFDLVPASILKVSQRLGGVTAGAFDDEGRLIAFVFGMTGVERGQLVHWSDMLGVREGARDRGLGRQLKQFQREMLQPLGVSVIYWTYDPLVARNAYLNLMQLGTDVVEYVPDMYGARTSSALHEGLGTDRFIVAWHIDDRHPRPRRAPLPALESPEAPIVGTVAQLAAHTPRVRIAIPLHIDQIQHASLAEAAQWRAQTRPLFQAAFGEGYDIVGFQRDDANQRGLYELLKRAT